jgi:hypothetical protein
MFVAILIGNMISSTIYFGGTLSEQPKWQKLIWNPKMMIINHLGKDPSDIFAGALALNNSFWQGFSEEWLLP